MHNSKTTQLFKAPSTYIYTWNGIYYRCVFIYVRVLCIYWWCRIQWLVLHTQCRITKCAKYKTKTTTKNRSKFFGWIAENEEIIANSWQRATHTHLTCCKHPKWTSQSVQSTDLYFVKRVKEKTNDREKETMNIIEIPFLCLIFWCCYCFFYSSFRRLIMLNVRMSANESWSARAGAFRRSLHQRKHEQTNERTKDMHTSRIERSIKEPFELKDSTKNCITFMSPKLNQKFYSREEEE